VDLLASEGVDVVARCAGGNNAGHTVVVGDAHFAFHLLPSGVVLPDCVALLGNGVVIHLPDMLKEIAENEEKGNF
jgi:adenylosuccinate synthase